MGGGEDKPQARHWQAQADRQGGPTGACGVLRNGKAVKSCALLGC